MRTVTTANFSLKRFGEIREKDSGVGRNNSFHFRFLIANLSKPPIDHGSVSNESTVNKETTHVRHLLHSNFIFASCCNFERAFLDSGLL